jgi:hypothetical protein
VCGAGKDDRCSSPTQEIAYAGLGDRQTPDKRERNCRADEWQGLDDSLPSYGALKCGAWRADRGTFMCSGLFG